MTRTPTAPWRAAALALATVTAACGGSSTSAPTSPGTGGGGGSRTSHNAGQDCLRCHRDFGVAGTVYRADGSAYSGATVRLTTAASGGGSAVLTLTSDARGQLLHVAVGRVRLRALHRRGGHRWRAAVDGGRRHERRLQLLPRRLEPHPGGLRGL